VFELIFDHIIEIYVLEFILQVVHCVFLPYGLNAMLFLFISLLYNLCALKYLIIALVYTGC